MTKGESASPEVSRWGLKLKKKKKTKRKEIEVFPNSTKKVEKDWVEKKFVIVGGHVGCGAIRNPCCCSCGTQGTTLLRSNRGSQKNTVMTGGGRLLSWRKKKKSTSRSIAGNSSTNRVAFFQTRLKTKRRGAQRGKEFRKRLQPRSNSEPRHEEEYGPINYSSKEG